MPQLVRFLGDVLAQVSTPVAEHEPRHVGLLLRFTNVVVTDSSVVKLHRLLSKCYPRSSPVAVKLHLVMSVSGNGMERVKLTEERANDHHSLRSCPWVRDRLLVFNRGYFRYQMFDCIDRNGGYLLSRLPLRANPRIVGVHRRCRGRSIELEGRRLDEIADSLKRALLDVELEVEFKSRAYGGTRRTHRRRFRLVSVRDGNSDAYRFYLTNIPPEDLDAESVAQVYACRWQVELIFRQLRSSYRLDELTTLNAPTVEARILSSVLTLLVSRQLLDAVRGRLRRQSYHVPEDRWASLFAAVAILILDIVMLPARLASSFACRLEPMLLHKARDPNVSRLLLLERVDQGVAWTR